MSSTAKLLRATALGLLLATFPFLHRLTDAMVPHDAKHAMHATGNARTHDEMDPAVHAKMHGDHNAHHGGQLGMAGDYHLELVTRDRNVEIHVSDALRAPLAAAHGTLDYGDGISRKLRWQGEFLQGPYVRGAESVNAVVTLANGEQVEIEFWFATDPS